GIEDRLRQAFRLAERDSLAVGAEREAADLHLIAGFLRLGLCQTDRRDLRMAIGASRNFKLVEGMRWQTLDRLDADHTLVLGLVSQHRRPGDVADGVDARHVRAPVTVSDNNPALHLHAELLEPEILDVPHHTDR